MGPAPALPERDGLLVGVVHLLALPGAPRHAGDMAAVLDHARADARALAAGGVDAIVVENFGDVPFHAGPVPAETVAGLALALAAVREEAPRLCVGVNVLRNDARAGLGLAAATGAAFVRVNVHAGAAVTDQGLVQGRAAETLRERARLAPRVALLADVHVKHASPLGRETIADAAEETLERALADLVIVTGPGTGREAAREDLVQVAERVGRERVLIGSGLDLHNAAALLEHARGAIVGTALKHDGDVSRPVDPARVEALRRALDAARRA